MEEKAKSTEVDDQLHAIWSVSISQFAYSPLMVNSAAKGSALFLTMLGLYYHWNRPSLSRREQEKVSIPPSFKLSSPRLTLYSTCNCNLHQIRWSDDSDLWHLSRWRGQSSKCGGTSGKKVQKTIVRVYLSTTCRCLLRRQVLDPLAPRHGLYGSAFNPMADLHSETGNHQDQVKVLIEKTASSLDDTALKMLFVSVQQNNIDLCVRYAINGYVMLSLFVRFDNDLYQLNRQDRGL